VLLLSVLFLGLGFGNIQAQKIADVLPENTILYGYANDFKRMYDNYFQLYFGARGHEVEDKLKGIIQKLVSSPNLEAAGFSQEFIQNTLANINGIHLAFLGMGPGMPNLLIAIEVRDEAHYANILSNPQMLGGLLMPGEYAGVPIYSTQMPVPVDITLYQNHLIVTNQPGLINQIIDSKFNISPNLSGNPRYKKFASLQRPGHCMTLFVDIASGLNLLKMMGATNDPEFQMANSILELDKLEVLGIQVSADNQSSSLALHLTMNPSHSFYNAIRVEPAPRRIAQVLPGRVLFSATSSLGNASEYLNRVIGFIASAASKSGGPPVQQQIQMMEKQMGYTLNELMSHVGSEISLFALPVDGMDVKNVRPDMVADRFGLAVAILDVNKAKAFADRLFNSPMIAKNLQPANWKSEVYNGTTIRSNVPRPEMPIGLFYAFVTHPASGTYLVVAPSATAIKECVDAASGGNSLATSRGYQIAFELMNVTSSREFYIDLSSLLLLLKSMPEMAPFAGMFESSMSSDTPQQFAVVTVEKAGAFSLLTIVKSVPQDMTDAVLEQLNMLEMFIPAGGNTGGSPFSRPTKEE
ncbi:MAG: DUF3352 domain-containing protein, partial [Planctomycetota bacterium]